MAEFSKIAWTTHTFNPWVGCTRVSPGCQNCYAENLMANRYKLVKWGPGQERVRTKTWNDPVRWNRGAANFTYPFERPRVFCASLADFLDEEIDPLWRADLFALIERCSNLDWLLLTKRIEHAAEMLPPAWLAKPLPWVLLGVTAESQEWWDRRVPILQATPVALRWVSYEPSLGPLKVTSGVDWVIIGGESAQAFPAREFHLEWSERVIADCWRLGIAPFQKQVGSNAFYGGERFLTKDKAGADPSEWPMSIRVREFPYKRLA